MFEAGDGHDSTDDAPRKVGRTPFRVRVCRPCAERKIQSEAGYAVEVR